MSTYCNQNHSSTYHFVLEGVITCVGFSDFLNVTLYENLHHFDADGLVIVTSHEDKDTQNVCKKHGVRYVCTDTFNERAGDKFNKGLGINIGLAHLRHMGWILHLDADIALPDNFRQQLQRARLQPDCIYGADRLNVLGYDTWEKLQSNGRFKRQYQYKCFMGAPAELPIAARLIHNEYGYAPIGFFQLWHASHHNRYPINQGSAEHTDVLHSLQWPANKRHILPTAFVYHLESEPSKMGVNWNGRKTKLFKPD